VLRLPQELARVDALLDDLVFFAPFAPFFDPRLGRPSTPMEVHPRLMFLKFRYRLGRSSVDRLGPHPPRSPRRRLALTCDAHTRPTD
jgi:IS5 family transposase